MISLQLSVPEGMLSAHNETKAQKKLPRKRRCAYNSTLQNSGQTQRANSAW